MCLSIVYKGKEKKEALAKFPETGYYWKVVTFIDGKYYPSVYKYSEPFKTLNVKKKPLYRGMGYNLAFHIFRYKKDAIAWRGWLDDRVVRCKVKKQDIVAIGTQRIFGMQKLVIVTKRFWCPRPPKK